MSSKNYKHSKRAVAFYRLNYDFRPPFTVLLDGNFVYEALRRSYDIKKLLFKHLRGKLELVWSGCVEHELSLIGEPGRGALDFLHKNAKRTKCFHQFNLEPSLCIEKHVGSLNKRKYIVATQDSKLIEALEKVPGVPVFQIKNEMLGLLDPSEHSEKVVDKKDKRKFLPTKEEEKVIKPYKEKEIEEKKREEMQEVQRERNQAGVKLKKRAKAPNPLAVKRKHFN
jgi:U3 small nucleolar RNA-associated protein 23